MEQILTILLVGLLGGGLGLLLVGEIGAPGRVLVRGEKARRRSVLPAEAYRPWQMVGLPVWVGLYSLTALLSLAVLALTGPLLALATAVLAGTSAGLIVTGLRRRGEGRIHAEALGLAEALASAVSQGATLPDALSAYVRRHAGRRLSREVQAYLLAPLGSGMTPAEVLNEMTTSPRYGPHVLYRRLLANLARGARASLTPEERAEELGTFLDTVESIAEAQQELLVDATQTRYTRWLVTGIIVGTILFLVVIMPGTRQHWLHDLVGQITVLVVAVLIAGSAWLGERLTQLEAWRF